MKKLLKVTLYVFKMGDKLLKETLEIMSTKRTQ